MPYTSIPDADIQTGKPVKQSLWQKVKDNLDYLYGVVNTLGAVGDQFVNGSFEVDSDVNGIPDGWTRYLYPGGAGAYETSDVAHGAKSYKFTHPGGAGNGGGYLESDYIQVGYLKRKNVTFGYKASVAGMKVMAQMLYYDKDKVLLGTLTVYTSTSNPTEWTCVVITQPPVYSSSAKFFKLRLIGGYSDTDVAGIVKFDCVSLEESAPNSLVCVAETINQAEVFTTSNSYVAVGASYSITVPTWAYNMVVAAEIKSSDWLVTIFGGVKVGAIGSPVIGTNSTTYVAVQFICCVAAVPGAQTLRFWLQSDGATSAYVRSLSATSQKAYQIRTRTVDDLLGTTTDS